MGWGYQSLSTRRKTQVDSDKILTRAEAEELIGTERNGGKVIGVSEQHPTRPGGDGVYLTIVHADKKATYERVG